MNAEQFAQRITLNDTERLALAAGQLAVMNADLEEDANPERTAIRNEFRASLRTGPLGDAPAAPGHLRVEDATELRRLLQQCTDTPRCLGLLVELCALQPFAGEEHELDEWVRERSLASIARDLGGAVDRDDIERIDAHLKQGREAARFGVSAWAMLGGGAGGLVAGGAHGALLGVAVGAVARELARQDNVDGVALQLFALVRTFDDYATEDFVTEPEDTTFRTLSLAGRALFDELEDELGNEASSDEELEDMVTVVARLRRELAEPGV